MSGAKLVPTDKSVIEFIESVENPKKKEDAYRLLKIFQETSGFEPKMWGSSIIGFGSYHYKYASGREGDAPLVGFSPRKAKISLYLFGDEDERGKLLENFGKHTLGKGCVYMNKLDDVDEEVLKDLIRYSMNYLLQMYPQT